MLFGKTSANNPSRFVEEIPGEYIERKEAARNDTFGMASEFRTRSEFGSYSSGIKKPFAQERPKYASIPQSAPKAAVNFSVGDKIVHKAFGDGEIIKMTQMGGDHLVEIEFSGGIKRLMMKAAAEHIQKK